MSRRCFKGVGEVGEELCEGALFGRVKAGENVPRCVEVVGEPVACLVVTVPGDGESDGAAVLGVGVSRHELLSELPGIEPITKIPLNCENTDFRHPKRRESTRKYLGLREGCSRHQHPGSLRGPRHIAQRELLTWSTARAKVDLPRYSPRCVSRIIRSAAAGKVGGAALH